MIIFDITRIEITRAMTDIDRTWFQAEAALFLLDVCSPRLVDSVGMLNPALIEIGSRIWQ